MKRWPLLLYLFVFVILLATCAQINTDGIEELPLSGYKEKGTLVIGTAITKPFEFYDPETYNLVGFDVDMATHIGQKLGLEVVFSEMPFGSLIQALQNREVDIVIAAMYIKPERETEVNFAIPYMETGLVMVVSPEFEGQITAVEHLADFRVGVKAGATGEQLAQQLVDRGIKLIPLKFETTQDSFVALETGQIDVVLNDYLNTLFYLKDTNSDLKIVTVQQGQVLFLSHTSLGIAVNQADAELLRQINLVLQEMYADGTYNQLYEKWLEAN